MSYDTLKKLNINLKDLSIKYAYSSSNVRDYRDRMVTTEVEKNFNSMELKMPELLQCLAELKIDKAKKIEQEIFTNLDNAINWYYKFYPVKTDEEKDGLLTVEFKRNKTKKAIQELIKRIEKTTTIEEAKTILEDFNFTPPETKSKKSYIT